MIAENPALPVVFVRIFVEGPATAGGMVYPAVKSTRSVGALAFSWKKSVLPGIGGGGGRGGSGGGGGGRVGVDYGIEYGIEYRIE